MTEKLTQPNVAISPKPDQRSENNLSLSRALTLQYILLIGLHRLRIQPLNNSNRVLLTLAIASLFISAYFTTSQKLIAQTQTFSVVAGVVRPPNSGSQRTESSFTFPEFTENTRLTARFQIAALDDNGVDQNNVAGQQRDPFDRAGYFYFRDTDDGEICLLYTSPSPRDRG